MTYKFFYIIILFFTLNKSFAVLGLTFDDELYDESTKTFTEFFNLQGIDLKQSLIKKEEESNRPIKFKHETLPVPQHSFYIAKVEDNIYLSTSSIGDCVVLYLYNREHRGLAHIDSITPKSEIKKFINLAHISGEESRAKIITSAISPLLYKVIKILKKLGINDIMLDAKPSYSKLPLLYYFDTEEEEEVIFPKNIEENWPFNDYLMPPFGQLKHVVFDPNHEALGIHTIEAAIVQANFMINLDPENNFFPYTGISLDNTLSPYLLHVLNEQFYYQYNQKILLNLGDFKNKKQISSLLKYRLKAIEYKLK